MSLSSQHLVPQMVPLFGEILENVGSRDQLEEVDNGSGSLSLYSWSDMKYKIPSDSPSWLYTSIPNMQPGTDFSKSTTQIKSFLISVALGGILSQKRGR